MLLAGVVTGVQAKDKCIFLQRIKSDIKAKQQEMEDSSRQIMQLKEEVLLKEKEYFIARTEQKKYEFLKEHWVHLLKIKQVKVQERELDEIAILIHSRNDSGT